MSVEEVEEEELTMKKAISGNARLAACIGPPRRPTQTTDHVGSSHALRFASDQRGMSSFRRFVEAAEEEVQRMERSTSENVRSAACTGPPKRPAPTAGYVGPSFV